MDKTNSPEEVLDVVDENDVVVARASRKKIHSNPPLLHREVGVLVYDENGRVLIQQRGRRKEQNALVWSWSAGGHVPSGFSPDGAAKKELMEEVGLSGQLEFVNQDEVRNMLNQGLAFSETAKNAMEQFWDCKLG